MLCGVKATVVLSGSLIVPGGVFRWQPVCRLGLMSGAVLKARALRDEVEKGARCAMWPVHPSLPFADGLLPGAHCARHLLLCEAKVRPQRPHAI